MSCCCRRSILHLRWPLRHWYVLSAFFAYQTFAYCVKRFGSWLHVDNRSDLQRRGRTTRGSRQSRRSTTTSHYRGDRGKFLDRLWHKQHWWYWYIAIRRSLDHSAVPTTNPGTRTWHGYDIHAIQSSMAAASRTRIICSQGSVQSSRATGRPPVDRNRVLGDQGAVTFREAQSCPALAASC